MKIFASLLILTASATAATSALADLSCPAYSAKNLEFKMSALNAPAGHDGTIQMPANMQTIFRGIYESNTQFDLSVAVHGMLGEKNWMVGSPMFFAIHNILIGKWTVESDFFPTGGLPYKMYKYLNVRGILEDVNALMKCREPHFYSNEEANLIAADLMNKVFFNTSRAALVPRYLNIADAQYYAAEPNKLGFANNAVDFIIGSVYDQVASIYGIKTLVLKDRRNRGVDLGWWNKVHNNAYFQSWVDNGEIDIPGYISSDEVVGFQQRTVDRARAGWGQAAIDNGVEFAYYKMSVGGKTVVAIIDGAGDNCIVEGRDGRYYSCERNWGKITTTVVPFPAPHSLALSSRKGLIGLIEVCPNGTCDSSSDLFSTYGRYSSRELPASVVQEISAMKINGEPVKLLLSRNSAVAAAQFSGIKVMSATYAAAAEVAQSTGNVTKAAGDFANGKFKVDYKISPKYLHVGGDGSPRSFAINWICGDSPKIPHSLTVPSPAANKTIQLTCAGE